MTTASLNFTGRKRIQQKHFSLTRTNIGDDANYIELNLMLDKSIIASITEDDTLVLDIINKADHERFELKPVAEQKVRPASISGQKTLNCRVAIVEKATQSAGTIKSSASCRVQGKSSDPTRPVGDETQQKEVEQTINFFRPEESNEIGEHPWKIDFNDPGQIRILINTRVLQAFGNNYKNPILRAMVFPPMIREVLTGIIVRMEDVQDLVGLESEQWFKWGAYISDTEYPSFPFGGDGMANEDWLEWVEKVSEALVASRFGTEQTLLSNMENYTDAGA